MPRNKSQPIPGTRILISTHQTNTKLKGTGPVTVGGGLKAQRLEALFGDKVFAMAIANAQTEPLEYFIGNDLVQVTPRYRKWGRTNGQFAGDFADMVSEIKHFSICRACKVRRVLHSPTTRAQIRTLLFLFRSCTLLQYHNRVFDWLVSGRHGRLFKSMLQEESMDGIVHALFDCCRSQVWIR